MDDDGNVGYVTSYMDDTERRQLTDELRASRESYRQVIENSERLIYTYDIPEKRAYLPERMRKLLALPSTVENVPDCVLAQGAIPADSIDTYHDLYANIRSGRPCEREWLMQRKTGRGDIVWLKARYILTQSADGRPLSATIYMDDVTVSKHKEDDLLDRAERDGMTGLYNRAAAENYIQKEMCKGGVSCVLLLLDLDNLKDINDSLGHEQGDRALKAVAHVMTTHFRRSDIVGRLGGDEFLVYLANVADGKALQGSLSALLRKLSMCAIGSNDSRFIHCSIGVAEGIPGKDDFPQLYKRADTALYHVKRNGKNNFAFYTPAMEAADFQYKARSQMSLREESLFDPSELRRLLSSIASIYQMVISVNLSKDYYYLMEYGAYIGQMFPLVGTTADFKDAALKLLHQDDRQTFIDHASREAMLTHYAQGQTAISLDLRRRGEKGGFEWFNVCILLYPNDDGDVCEFTLIRRAEEKERVQTLLKLNKIMELALGRSFEYIGILHPEDGSYQLYGNDAGNTLDIPRHGDYNQAIRAICNRCITPKERNVYNENAALEGVLLQMEQNDGYYRYRCTMEDGVREIEYFWYEPTHHELLMTVRRVCAEEQD